MPALFWMLSIDFAFALGLSDQPCYNLKIDSSALSAALIVGTVLHTRALIAVFNPMFSLADAHLPGSGILFTIFEIRQESPCCCIHQDGCH